jgi:hypothetical protein
VDDGDASHEDHLLDLSELRFNFEKQLEITDIFEIKESII